MIGELLLVAGFAALRGSPTVEVILPRGGQRGTELAVTFHGDRLADAAEALFFEPGIEVTKLEAPDEKHAVATLKIAADCTLGEHRLRLRTRTGLSELRTFWIGPFPCVDEKEPNGDLEHAQPIEKNVTVHGTITNEDVDVFAVEAKAGERLSAEVEGLRLGETLFDPFLAILDEKRFEIASCDDSALFKQDPVVSCIVPADGRYFVLVREASYGGNDRCRYRLHVGTYPRPLVAFPPGAKVGSDVALELLGDVKGEIPFTFHVPDKAPPDVLVFPEQDGVPAPSGVALRTHGFDSVLEREPNDTIEQARATDAAAAAADPTKGGVRSPPIAFDGILDHPGDVDFVRFAAKKDERFHVRVNARNVRSPLDPVMSIHAADGRQLEQNDDQIGLDSYLQFAVPADGEYFVRVSDHLGGGGPLYVWRLAISPVLPSLSLDVPRFGRDPQARQFAPVPRGNRYAMVVHCGRAAFSAPVTIGAEGLPDGVTATAVPMAKNLDTTLLLFEAAADAPLAGRLVDLVGQCADPPIKGHLRQRVELVVAPPNDTNFYDTTVDRLAVAVAEEAPFKLEVEAPKGPLVQFGACNFKVRAERKQGFDAPIVVRMLWLPPGLGSQPTLTIPQGQSELAYGLNAGGDAQPGTYQLALLGEAESGRGVVLASSALAPITVAPPFLSLKLDLAAIEQGKPGQVVAHVETATPYEGKAKVKLHGLPPKCTAEDKEISAGDTTVVFDVATAADTPAGKHTSLFCEIDVPLAAETIVHYLGGGATLRVDAPAPVAAVAAAAKPAQEAPKPAEPAKAPAKPLSRLEKLRLESQQKTQKGDQQ